MSDALKALQLSEEDFERLATKVAEQVRRDVAKEREKLLLDAHVKLLRRKSVVFGSFLFVGALAIAIAPLFFLAGADGVDDASIGGFLSLGFGAVLCLLAVPVAEHVCDSDMKSLGRGLPQQKGTGGG